MKGDGQPVCHVVAGPNGSGKSTFALEYLPTFAGSIEYVNPDMMAKGFSPVDMRLSAMNAGRPTLRRIAALIASGYSFGFETTLSGRGHLKLLAEAKASGYAIHLYYLWMPERMMLPSRIRHRVLAGGHDVPTSDVLRRYERSIGNVKDYATLADVLYVFDASRLQQEMIYRRNGGEQEIDPRRVPIMRKALGL